MMGNMDVSQGKPDMKMLDRFVNEKKDKRTLVALSEQGGEGDKFCFCATRSPQCRIRHKK